MRSAWRGRPHTPGRRYSMRVASTRCAPCPREGVRPVWMASNCRRWRARCWTNPPSMALAPSRGRSSAWACSSSACTALSSARRRSGASWAVWGSRCKSPSAVRLSATRMPCRSGSARPGLRSKKAKRQGRLIVFIDESGLSERPTRVRTWAPRGKTPIVQFHLNWTHISVIAGLSRTNCLFRLHEGSIKKDEQRMIRPTFADHGIDDAMIDRVRQRYAPHQGEGGAHFTRPMHVRLLRKAH